MTDQGSDVNMKFGIAITQLDNDSGIKGDYLTNLQKLSFTGKIENYSTDFSAKVLVQLFSSSGTLLSNDYVPLSNTGIWNFAKTDYIYGENNQNTHYILKASMVDVAGNILKSIDQSFVVDLLKPSFIRTDREFIFIASESGDFIFNGIIHDNKNQLDL